MKLIVVNSNSSGNAYALDSGTEILLLEAGCKFSVINKAIQYRTDEVVACFCTHSHGDHFCHALDFAKRSIHIYSCHDAIKSKPFPFGTAFTVVPGKTYHIGSFSVTPFDVAHDVPCLGYLISHPDMGILLFATDTYKVPINITGVNHYLIEANYSDTLLKENVWNGKISKSQADRIMLSHMSLDYTVKYLLDCSVGADSGSVGGGSAATKTITLCHLSERNADPDLFQRTVAGAFAIPTYIAHKGTVVNINKETI